MMAWWMWLLLGLILLLVELITPGGFFFVFFGAGAIAVGLLAAAGLSGPVWMQWLLFSAVSVVALAVFRKPLLQRMRQRQPTHEVDQLIGQTAITACAIDAGGFGKAELRGASWNARNAGDTALAAGQRCRVIDVDGLTLLIRG